MNAIAAAEHKIIGMKLPNILTTIIAERGTADPDKQGDHGSGFRRIAGGRRVIKQRRFLVHSDILPLLCLLLLNRLLQSAEVRVRRL